MYDTVIFDLDGTLLNTLDDLYEGVNNAMLICGFPLKTKDEVRLAVGNGIEIVDAEPEGNFASVMTGIAKVCIPMDDLVNREEERARLKKELATAEQELARANAKLANPGFVAKAPAALIDAEKAKVVKFADLIEKVKEQLAKLG